MVVVSAAPTASGSSRSPGQLLAEPADDEEGVVDRQPHAEQGDHVDREDRDLGEQGHQPDDRQRADHGERPDQHRHRGGDQAAEDQHRQDRDHRQRDRLGPAQVLLGEVVDVGVDRVRPGELGPQALGAKQRLDLVEAVEQVVVVSPASEISTWVLRPSRQTRPGERLSYQVTTSVVASSGRSASVCSTRCRKSASRARSRSLE